MNDAEESKVEKPAPKGYHYKVVNESGFVRDIYDRDMFLKFVEHADFQMLTIVDMTRVKVR